MSQPVLPISGKTPRSLSSCKKSNLKMAFSKLKYIILSYLVMLWFKTGTETAHKWTRLIAAASGALVC